MASPLIEKAFIKNFKGISECKIEGLSNINLFIGKNNSCKSTIMEAIHAVLREFNTPYLGTIIPRRSNVSSAARELWYNYDTNCNLLIRLTFNGKYARLDGYYDKKSQGIASSVSTMPTAAKQVFEGPTSFYSSSNWSNRTVTSTSRFLDVFPLSKRDEFESYTSNSRFIDSSSRNDLRYIETLLGRIKNEEKTEEFGNLLHEVYGIGPEWEFRPHPDFEGVYRVAVKGNVKYIFLEGLGDGMRFAMMILANCLLVKDAAIFIEEIESNQHPASLRRILNLLVTISKANNLQLFITTHSPRLWREFEVIFEKTAEQIDELQCYLVERNSKSGVVNCKAVSKRNYDLFISEVENALNETKGPIQK